MTQSSVSAMSEVMEMALARSGLPASEIQYVNAHATGTVHGDAEEAQAIARVFGTGTPVSSLKGHFGHSLAACGALEAIAAVKMMQERLLIPTRNLARIDEVCSGIDHLREIRPTAVRHVLSNNFAFGGMNTSLVLSQVES
jgi:3-oxoacyl-[acyl-carrier-protein] synthase II